MKQIIAFILSLLLLTTALIGCNKPNDTSTENTQVGHIPGSTEDFAKLGIVCTIFPQYDWVREILGERLTAFDLTLLLTNRIDLHNYQPSVDDIIRISTCDLFIYVGGESDKWVENALRQAVNPDMIVINLLSALGDDVKLDEIIEGMEHAHDLEEEGEHDDDDEHDEDELEYDEHVWLSLLHAQTFCKIIAAALVELDESNASVYNSNLLAYTQKLSELDTRYRTAINEAQLRTFLFADRFPFRYLADDYGISFYAAFPGCSAETEASFETIVFLSEKVDEADLKCIMVTESADQSIARTIVSNTKDKNQSILVLNAMQSVDSGDMQSGASYLSIMESNLTVLEEALT